MVGLLSTSPACLDKSDWGDTTEAVSYTGRDGDEAEGDEDDEEELELLWEIEETEADEMGGGLEGVEMREGGGVGLDTLLKEEKEEGEDGTDEVGFEGTGGEGEGEEGFAALP